MKAVRLSGWGVALLLLPPVAPAQILAGAPDPAIIAVPGQGVYVFATGRGIRVLHSENLVDWEHTGHVFDQPAPAWAQEAIPKAEGVWAPDISVHQGRYYLYYSVSSFGSQRSAIGLVVNRTLNPKHPDFRKVCCSLPCHQREICPVRRHRCETVSSAGRTA